ncbi:ABC transporter substrate-binding protein [Streptomyces catenulae]|uniref:ABC transporter substrate-binding protein n=1 Tax=Streptomyces catenulae TaxID=66875 RepID=A0ABV2Z2M4_9ACTN|nr:ABC transporter substrate-binding protein [Streptomyces catenulae]
MTRPRSPRRTARTAAVRTAALLAAAALPLAGCAEPAATGADAPGGGATAVPTADVVSGIAEDPAAAALLPADVRARGTLALAASISSLPGAVYLPDGRTVAGEDIDLADAVGKALGLRLKREPASFEAILPALGSGRYDVGTGNFGVTDARRKTLDFVTYVNDGQGFAVREDSTLKKVTTLTQLCGLTVATGAGTTFEATLEQERPRCAAAGKKPYDVKTYAEISALYASLQQGRTDVVMSTVNGLRYAVDRQPGLRFLNAYKRLDVGFALKKHSPLAPAFRAAVNHLIENGSYHKILKKWGTADSALTTSRISPPEIR